VVNGLGPLPAEITDASGELERLPTTVAGFRPVYLSPAISRTKAIRLNQVWVPRTRPTEPVEAEEEEAPTRTSRGHGISQRPAELADNADEEPEYAAAATRMALRPHDPYTGEEIDRDEVRKGYEYERGQFVTFTPEELKSRSTASRLTCPLLNTTRLQDTTQPAGRKRSLSPFKRLRSRCMGRLQPHEDFGERLASALIGTTSCRRISALRSKTVAHRTAIGWQSLPETVERHTSLARRCVSQPSGPRRR
jgi:hypothetical protein